MSCGKDVVNVQIKIAQMIVKVHESESIKVLSFPV